jgi:hypothetical protein
MRLSPAPIRNDGAGLVAMPAFYPARPGSIPGRSSYLGFDGFRFGLLAAGTGGVFRSRRATSSNGIGSGLGAALRF